VNAPTTAAVRRYLAEVLWDHRVLSMHAVPRALLLYGAILPFRPAKSAEAYRTVWDPVTGSPLMHHSMSLTAAVRAAFAPYVRLDSLQLLRLELPAEFEEALMRTVITRLTILEAVRFQARRAVEFRTLTLASRYSAVATVILARGNASRVRQRAFGL
jgi:ferrochelatase